MPASIVRTGDGRVVPRRAGPRRTIVRHDRRRCAMVLRGFDEEVANDVHREPAAMSILERFTSPPRAPAAGGGRTATGSAYTAGASEAWKLARDEWV